MSAPKLPSVASAFTAAVLRSPGTTTRTVHSAIASGSYGAAARLRLSSKLATESQTTSQAIASALSSAATRATGILCIGDSLTQGFTGPCMTAFSPYTDQFHERLKRSGKGHIKIENNGVTGEQTTSIRQRLQKAISSKDFSWVVLLGGANDLGRRTSDDIYNTLIAMHDEARQANAKVAFMTIPESKRRPTCDEADRQEVNRRLRAFSAAHKDNTILIDVATALPQDAAHARLWSDDTVHLTTEGYRRLGDVVADSMLRVV